MPCVKRVNKLKYIDFLKKNLILYKNRLVGLFFGGINMATNKKELIIQEATNLFQQKGYLGVGVSEILKVCDISKGAFYHHFPNGKEELLITCLYTMNETIIVDMKKIFSSVNTASEAFELMIRELIKQYERDHAIIGYTFSSIISEIGLLSDEVRDVCKKSYANIQAIYIEKLIEDGFTEEQAEEFAVVLNATIEGSIMLSLTTQSTKPLQMVLKTLPKLIQK